MALTLLVCGVARAQETPADVPAGAAPPAPAVPAGAVTTAPVPYWGYHPVPDGQGTFCTEPGPHGHEFAPFDLHLFVWYQGSWVFIGDPYHFGYAGGVVLYYDHHPHPWGGWCYLFGPHHHLFGPWGDPWAHHGPYVYFVGVYDPWYWDHYHLHVHYYTHVYPHRHRIVRGDPRRAGGSMPPGMPPAPGRMASEPGGGKPGGGPWLEPGGATPRPSAAPAGRGFGLKGMKRRRK